MDDPLLSVHWTTGSMQSCDSFSYGPALKYCPAVTLHVCMVCMAMLDASIYYKVLISKRWKHMNITHFVRLPWSHLVSEAELKMSENEIVCFEELLISGNRIFVINNLSANKNVLTCDDQYLCGDFIVQSEVHKHRNTMLWIFEEETYTAWRYINMENNN